MMMSSKDFLKSHS